MDPLPGVLLCFSAREAHRGAPRQGSYSVLRCLSHLMEHPGWGPMLSSSVSGSWWASLSIAQLPLLACGDREAMEMAPPPTRDSHYRLASMAAWLSSTGISHDLLSHIPSIHLSAVNSSPRTGIAPQSLHSSSQSLPLPENPCSCLAYVWLWQGLSDSHSI